MDTEGEVDLIKETFCSRFDEERAKRAILVNVFEAKRDAM